MDHDEIVRLYGPWAPRSPSDVLDLFAGYPGDWWIAGGWAIEAFTGRSRPHGDVDPSIPRGDVRMLRDHVRGRLDVWAADQGSLRPVVDEDAALTTTCSNLWLRSLSLSKGPPQHPTLRLAPLAQRPGVATPGP